MGGSNRKSYGYSDILNQHDTNLNKSYYILPRLDYNSYFQVRIPSKRESRSDLVAELNVISIYADGSKMECGVGIKVYSRNLDISLCNRLPNSASICQADILGIEKACGVLLTDYGRI